MAGWLLGSVYFVASVDHPPSQWAFTHCLLQLFLLLRRVLAQMLRMKIKSLKSVVCKVFALYDANKCLLQQSYLLREISIKVVSLRHDSKITAL